MGPLPSPGAVVQTNLTWKVDDDTGALTRLFWSYTGGAPSGAALTSFCADVDAAVDTFFGPLFLATTLATGTKAIDLSSDTGNEAESTQANAGSRSGTRLSPGTAVTVAHEIARRYRGGHPRSYLPFGAGADILSSGEWDTAFTNAVTAAFANFVTTVRGSGHVAIDKLVNVSYYKGNNPIIDPISGRAKNIPQKRVTPLVNEISGSVARVKIGSQRRRNRKS